MKTDNEETNINETKDNEDLVKLNNKDVKQATRNTKNRKLEPLEWR